MNNKKEIKTSSTTRAFFKFLKEIANFRRIEIELVKQILEEAFIKTIQKKFDPEAEIELVVDFENEEFRLVNKKALVVSDEVYKEDIKDEEGMKVSEISISEAISLYGKNISIDDEIQINIDFETLPKSIFTPVQQQFKQKIAEIVRIRIYEKYLPLKGTTIKAKMVSKLKSGFLYEIEEDKVNAFMPKKLASKNVPLGAVEEVYIDEVLEETKDTQIIISNSSNQILKELIKREIPEIESGEFEIKRIARKAGVRSKVAIDRVNKEDVAGAELIGTIIGQKANRINVISEELQGEKIDVIEFSDNIEEFIINALSPARVVSIHETKEGKIKKYKVIVPDSHNTIAIGKNGCNVSLAAELTRVKIDISSYSKALEEKMPITWNGNILNEEQMKEIDEIKNNEIATNRRQTYNRKNNNLLHKTNIMAEFEKDIEAYNEVFDSLYSETESSTDEQTTKSTIVKKPKSIKNDLDLNKIMEDAMADYKEVEFDDDFESVKKQEISYTQEEMKQIQEEIKNYKMDNDLASFAGLKDLQFNIDDADWDDDEEEE